MHRSTPHFLSLLLSLPLSAQVVWENLGPGSQFVGATILWETTNQRFLICDSNPPQLKAWSGTGWQTVATAPSSITLSDGRAAYDEARQRVVLVGAQANGFMGPVIVEWDGVNWQVFQPANFNQSPTWYGSVLYDPVRQKIFITDLLTRTWDGVTLTNLGQPPNGAYGTCFDPLSGRPMRPGAPPMQFTAANTWVPMPPTVQNGILGHHYFDPVTNTLQAEANPTYGYDPEYWDGSQWHQIKVGAVAPGASNLMSTAWSPVTQETWGILRTGTLRAVHGPQGAVQAFGSGCPGALGIPTVSAYPQGTWTPFPLVGQTTQYRISGVLPSPFGFPYLIVGFDRTSWGGQPLPLDANVFGMPGCWLNQSVDYFTQTFFVNVPIPASAGMVGFRYYVQGMGLELLGVNGPGTCMSRGMECTVGVWY